MLATIRRCGFDHLRRSRMPTGALSAVEIIARIFPSKFLSHKRRNGAVRTLDTITGETLLDRNNGRWKTKLDVRGGPWFIGGPSKAVGSCGVRVQRGPLDVGLPIRGEGSQNPIRPHIPLNHNQHCSS